MAKLRLLNANDCTLPNENDRKRQENASYVIISHRWLDDEVLYEDIKGSKDTWQIVLEKKKRSIAKLHGICRATINFCQGKFKYVWLDTVCIDKKDRDELAAAINSMYRWYKNAEVCFAYLHDYPSRQVSNFTQSEWFSRGWTLQELVAPKDVVFFDKGWNMIGDKFSLQQELTGRTGIAADYLLHRSKISSASISHRMSWFGGRQVGVAEDMAYCLMGIFGVNMPLLYGEGEERAFRRLQEEIMRYSDDHSLFAWEQPGGSECISGLLAGSPSWFRNSGKYFHHHDVCNSKPYQITNKGISIYLRLQTHQDGYIASIDCPDGEDHSLGIYLVRANHGSQIESQQYFRVKNQALCKVRQGGRGRVTHMYIKTPDNF